MSDLVIEYYAEPLPGDRGQLHIAVFKDGEQVLALSHSCGSPAPMETVRRHERTITIPATQDWKRRVLGRQLISTWGGTHWVRPAGMPQPIRPDRRPS